jgi:hypothetical protein
MAEYNADSGRREFVKLTVVGLSAASLANVLSAFGEVAWAADLPVTALAENDPQAAALGYKHDANQVDTAQFPVRATESGAKQYCYNCQLYTGVPGKEWGPCALFSYRTDPQTGKPLAVNVNGWCVAWGPRASARVPPPANFPRELSTWKYD